jgi:hypothetical protein
VLDSRPTSSTNNYRGIDQKVLFRPQAGLTADWFSRAPTVDADNSEPADVNVRTIVRDNPLKSLNKTSADAADNNAYTFSL